MAARELAKFQCTVVVPQRAGTVIAHGDIPHINPRQWGLATAGTGMSSRGSSAPGWLQGMTPLQAAIRAVFAHGKVADAWPLENL